MRAFEMLNMYTARATMAAVVVIVMLASCQCASGQAKKTMVVSDTTTTTLAPLTGDEKIQVHAIIQALVTDSGFAETIPIDTIYLDNRTKETMVGMATDLPLPKRLVSPSILQALRDELGVRVISAISREDVVDSRDMVIGNGVYVTVTVLVAERNRRFVGVTIYKGSIEGHTGSAYISYEVKQTGPEIILMPVSSARM